VVGKGATFGGCVSKLKGEQQLELSVLA
jgi:hypothetical protein